MHQNNDVRAANATPPTNISHVNETPRPKLAMDIIRRVAQKRNIAVDMMLNSSRCKRPVAEARQQAMYLAHVAAGFTMSSVGEIFGRDRTTIRHACARVEDRRDDADFDAFLVDLEMEIEKLKADAQ